MSTPAFNAWGHNLHVLSCYATAANQLHNDTGPLQYSLTSQLLKTRLKFYNQLFRRKQQANNSKFFLLIRIYPHWPFRSRILDMNLTCQANLGFWLYVDFLLKKSFFFTSGKLIPQSIFSLLSLFSFLFVFFALAKVIIFSLLFLGSTWCLFASHEST